MSLKYVKEKLPYLDSKGNNLPDLCNTLLYNPINFEK